MELAGDIGYTTLLLQSWWILLGIAVLGIIIGVASGHLLGSMVGGRNKAVAAVEVVNQILMTWNAYATEMAIAGQPVGVEFSDANPVDLKPEHATLVVKKGFRETRYRVVKEVRRVSGATRTNETWTFERDDGP